MPGSLASWTPFGHNPRRFRPSPLIRTERDENRSHTNSLDFPRWNCSTRVIPRFSGSSEIRATEVSTPAVASADGEKPRSAARPAPDTPTASAQMPGRPRHTLKSWRGGARGANQRSEVDSSGAIAVVGAAFEPHDMRQVEAQLGGILDRHDPV